VLTRQVLYHLNHTLALYALVTFWVQSCICVWGYPQTGILLFCLPHSWYRRHTTLYPTCLLRWSLANTLPGLASNHDPPDLRLLST
jgi:hypothetical protein